ncbi:hypothetical protein IFM61606_08901 [Aspergillus udagawae]|nr:hypothetical protein IFM61606_08901 [Aspergillus udagawae]
MRLARRPGVLLYATLLNITLRNDDHLSLRVAHLEDRLQHLSSQVPLSATALGTSPSSGPVLDTGTSSAASELPIPPRTYGTDRFEWVLYPVRQQEDVSKSEPGKLGLLRWPLGDEILSSGVFSIFSAENVVTLRKFVGDSVFRAIVEEVGALEAKRDTTFYSDESHSLPPPSIVSRYIDDFLMELNREIRLFDEQDVREAMKHYFESGVNHQPGWSMACNIILAHCVRNQSCCGNIAEYKRYFNGALVHVPRLMMGKGTPLEVLFCMFIGENQPAANLLGLAVRCMLRLEYHVQARQRQCTSLESLFQKRLFLKAYIFDRDLSMRLHSPPVISDSYIELPEETPVDGYSVYFLPGGVRVNYFREQVQLAKIQDQVHSELYSSQPIGLTQTQLHTKIVKEVAIFYAGDPDTLDTIKYDAFGDQVKSNTFTAHHKVDPVTNELVVFGYEAKGLATLNIVTDALDAQGRNTEALWLESPGCDFIHGCAITINFIVLFIWPFETRMGRLKEGSHYWSWHYERPAFIVVPQRPGAPQSAWETEDGTIYEEGSRVHDNAFPFFPPKDGRMPSPDSKADFVRWEFDLSKPTSTTISHPTVVLDLPSEFPRIDESSYIGYTSSFEDEYL